MTSSNVLLFPGRSICHSITTPNFMVIGLQIGKLHGEGAKSYQIVKTPSCLGLNNDEHTHLDKRTGNTSILDMAFISPNLTKHNIQFLIDDDLGSDHLPIEFLIDAQPYSNVNANPIRYKFDQIDREVFDSTLEAALSSGDLPALKSTQDIDKYADFCYQHCSR